MCNILKYITYNFKNRIRVKYVLKNENGFFGQLALFQYLYWKCNVLYAGKYLIKIKYYLYKCYKLPIIVKTLIFRYNQQVTKLVLYSKKWYSTYIVGTSETTRTSKIKFDDKELKFNQWLAGLIDGDGYFGVSKQGYTSCEITLSLNDEKGLRIIQNKLGGSIKLRSGVKAVRYRLHNKQGMVQLVNRVNGIIRNTNRIKQLAHVCTILNIDILQPEELNINHRWFTGFFDAEGCISMSMKNSYPQLTISVGNKLCADIEVFKTHFGGNIYYDRSQNGHYKWMIQKRSDVLNFYNYYKSIDSYSIKETRMNLIPDYYELLDQKAYNTDSIIMQKAWTIFIKKWKFEDIVQN